MDNKDRTYAKALRDIKTEQDSIKELLTDTTFYDRVNEKIKRETEIFRQERQRIIDKATRQLDAEGADIDLNNRLWRHRQGEDV